MKYLILLGCLLAFLPSKMMAQHCPFDGGHLIAVHLVDEQKKPIKNGSENLSLVEINNLVAESCSYAKGLLTKEFIPTKKQFQTHYEKYWENWIKPYYEDWIILDEGYYAVILNQSEESCMIKKGNEFDYRTREFNIKLQGFGKPQTIKVKEEDIYGLCTNGGSWKRIKPIEIKVKTK